jgi:hypothetical protein
MNNALGKARELPICSLTERAEKSAILGQNALPA